jgi:CRISPR/Cas system-associated exonuclease Cas4 (RecB family)
LLEFISMRGWGLPGEAQASRQQACLPSALFSGTIQKMVFGYRERFWKGGSAMGILKRLAYYLGLLLGLTTVAAAGTVALTYLLTGKFVSIKMKEEKPEVTLMTPDEVATLIRERAHKVPEQPVEIEIVGGESND